VIAAVFNHSSQKMQGGYLADVLRLVSVIQSSTGNNTGNRWGRLCGIVHSDAMRPAALSG
jgi:hypothetical protein